MEEKDLNKCKRILERENSLSDKRRMEILFNECKHPKWTNYNLFKGIIQEVDTRIQYYQLNIEKAENTGIRRVMDGASSDLVLEIRDYLKERLETCRAIMNIVKEFKKINRRLNSLTEVDRRKIKGILEEKMEKEEEAKIEQELRDEL